MSSSACVNTPATIDLQQLLSVCVDLSKYAGESIRRVFDSGNLGAIEKDPTAGAATSADFGAISDPQTLADLESQRIIIGNLVRLYGPDLTIVGEEGELEQSTGEGMLFRDARTDLLAGESFPEHLRTLETKHITLWVDPLDGTREFGLGFVHYVTVLIGISYKGSALGGVVHVPFVGGKYVQKADPLNPSHRPPPPSDTEGRTVWGAVGVGVRGMELARLDSTPADRRFITTTRSHFGPALKSLLDAMQPQAIIRCGGAGSKGLLVLGGEADAYVAYAVDFAEKGGERAAPPAVAQSASAAYSALGLRSCTTQGGTKRWDTCAIDACTKAIGGTFTDQYGDEIVYDPKASHENKQGLLATLRDHQHYVIPKPTQAEKEAAANCSKL